MSMKKVCCQLVYCFKGKLLLHVVFSPAFHVESTLKLLAMTRRHNLGSEDKQCKGFAEFQVLLTKLTISVLLAMASGHISVKLTEVEV